jgi:hypothetical protein
MSVSHKQYTKIDPDNNTVEIIDLPESRRLRINIIWNNTGEISQRTFDYDTVARKLCASLIKTRNKNYPYEQDYQVKIIPKED